MASYRAKPVTQRDGSDLQYANCRMASIAVGLDHQSQGQKTSTGQAMRRRQPDQEGGTDSSDAKIAWNSYDENLRVMDGSVWDDLLDDLKVGRLVHIDVWHAAVGGPCLSGSGGYGHTMAVAPESRERDGDTEWLVADPWCKPPKWVWTKQSKLRAGAEKWGSQIYTRATKGAPPPADERELIKLMVRAARELLKRFRPGGDEATEDPPDTGGAGGRIMYTTTRAASSTFGGGDDTVGIYWNPSRWKVAKDGAPVYADASTTDQVTKLNKGTVVTCLGVKAVTDADGKDPSWKAVLVVTGGLVPGGDDEAVKAVLWIQASDLAEDSEPTSQAWDDSIWDLARDPAGRYPCPAVPPSPDEECDERVAEAIEVRDLEWEEAMKQGEPWPSTV